MNAILPPLLVAALVMPIEAALLPYLGPYLGMGLDLSGRAEAPLCAVVLLAVGSASTIEGAVGSFLLGALADVTYQVHPGLFTLTSLVLFVLFRVGPIAKDVRGPMTFAILTALAVPLQAALAFGLLWLSGQPRPEGPLWSVVLGALLTGLLAPVFYWLSGFGSRLLEREDPSLLR